MHPLSHKHFVADSTRVRIGTFIGAFTGTRTGAFAGAFTTAFRFSWLSWTISGSPVLSQALLDSPWLSCALGSRGAPPSSPGLSSASPLRIRLGVPPYVKQISLSWALLLLLPFSLWKYLLAATGIQTLKCSYLWHPVALWDHSWRGSRFVRRHHG